MTVESSKLNILKSSIFLASGNLLSAAFRFGGQFIAMRIMEPGLLGLFSSISLILFYGKFFQLGIFAGLGRQLPFSLGKGDQEAGRQFIGAAGACARYLSFGVFAVFLVIVCFYLIQQQWLQVAGWLSCALALALGYQQDYLTATFRTGHDFERLGMVTATVEGVGFSLVLLVFLFGYYGLCLRLVGVGALYLFFLWRWRPEFSRSVRYRWNFATVKKLFLVGSPIFAVGYLQVIFLALPATLIVKSLGSAYLGLFQPALFLEAGVLVLVNAVSQILYVRMLETYAQTGSIGATCLMSVKPVILLGLVLLPVALVGWLGAPWFISTFLPKYTAGIPAAKWMIVSAYLEFLNPFLNMFAVIRKMGIYFLIMTAGVLAFFAVINLGIWPAADPLVPYALARIAGRVVILFLGLGVIFTLARQNAHAK